MVGVWSTESRHKSALVGSAGKCLGFGGGVCVGGGARLCMFVLLCHM